MSLQIKKQENETWRQAVSRIAGKHGLARECLEIFDEGISTGVDEGDLAFHALYEWDCTDFVEE